MSAQPTHFLSAADLITIAETWQPPSTLPPGDAGDAAIYRCATVWGVDVARGEIGIDDAYVLARIAAETLEVHTAGKRRWRVTKPFLDWLIDSTAERVGAYLDGVYGRASRDLRKAADAAISRGGGDRAVRAAIVSVADGFEEPLPEELLHEALNSAIAEARRNARWMSQRGTPQP